MTTHISPKLTITGIILASLLLIACHENMTTPINNQADGTDTNNTPTNPNIPIKVDLPIYLDGVPSLLHPITVSATDKYAEKSLSSEKVSSNISVNQYRIDGDLFNLVFENQQTGKIQSLFKNNNQLIYNATYLIHTSDNPQKVIYNDDWAYHQATAANYQTTITKTNKDNLKFYHHFIYKVKENIKDNANNNSVLAQTSLYMSNDMGNQLQKLHPNDQYVIETRWISQIDRYYFTTKSDSNHDGKITLADQSHNYYIDFKDINNPTIHSYDVMPK